MKLTTNRPFARSAESVRALRSTQISSVGGSAETLDTAVVVSPNGTSPSPLVVTIATPDGNDAMISKNDCRSTSSRPAGSDGSLLSSPPPPPRPRT